MSLMRLLKISPILSKQLNLFKLTSSQKYSTRSIFTEIASNGLLYESETNAN